MMESMNACFYQIRANFASLQDTFNKNMDWFKKKKKKKKKQLAEKDKEIEDLKKKLNEKSTR